MELLKSPKKMVGLVLTAILTTSVAPAIAIKAYRYFSKPFDNQAGLNDHDIWINNLRRDLNEAREEIKELRNELNDIERRIIYPSQRNAHRTDP